MFYGSPYTIGGLRVCFMAGPMLLVGLGCVL